MQNLLPEHVLLTASFLDGDSYLNLACTSQDNRRLFNDKAFLQQVYDLNKYPFLVLDARYYAYCYGEYFLSRQKLDANKPLLRKVLRTLRRGKMTRTGLESLQMYITSLKASGEKRSDNDRLLDKTLALLQGEKIVLAADLRSDLVSTLEGVRECYVYTEKQIIEFPENIQHLLQAFHHNQHDLIFELLDKHGAEIKNESINRFLSTKTDATTAAILLAFFGPPENPYETVYKLVNNDNAEALRVFFRFHKARPEELLLNMLYTFTIEKCIETDAVKCFAVLKEANYAGISESIVYERVLREDARKISSYYGIVPTFSIKAAGVLVDGLGAFVRWLLEP